MRSLKTILSRVNQLLARVQEQGAGDFMERVTAILSEARRRCAAGIPVPKSTDAELWRLAQGDGIGALIARRQLRVRE
jgi:hypothetical protein